MRPLVLQISSFKRKLSHDYSPVSDHVERERAIFVDLSHQTLNNVIPIGTE